MQRREQRPSRMSSAHGWATDREQRPRGSRGTHCKAGSSGCGSRPSVSPSKRRAHQAHTPPQRQSAALRESPPRGYTPAPTRAPDPGSRAHTPPARRHRRTQDHAEHIEGHVRQPRLVKHGLGPGGPARAADKAPVSRVPARG